MLCESSDLELKGKNTSEKCAKFKNWGTIMIITGGAFDRCSEKAVPENFAKFTGNASTGVSFQQSWSENVVGVITAKLKHCKERGLFLAANYFFKL